MRLSGEEDSGIKDVLASAIHSVFGRIHRVGRLLCDIGSGSTSYPHRRPEFLRPGLLHGFLCPNHVGVAKPLPGNSFSIRITSLGSAPSAFEESTVGSFLRRQRCFRLRPTSIGCHPNRCPRRRQRGCPPISNGHGRCCQKRQPY